MFRKIDTWITSVPSTNLDLSWEKGKILDSTILNFISETIFKVKIIFQNIISTMFLSQAMLS
jgi:hypothetical protein